MSALFSSEIVRATAGGVLIGLAAILLLVANGRVAGISGILGRLIHSQDGVQPWRVLFILGLVLGGAIAHAMGWFEYNPVPSRSIGMMMAAGLLVGIGTQLGSGCTSGHGVCGIGRFSRRSMVATLLFMLTGILTVFIIRTCTKGAP